MKFKNILITFLIIFSFLFRFINVNGNPVPIVYIPMYDDGKILFYFFIELPLIFLVTFNAEFLVVYYFLKKKIFNDSKIYKSIFAVNFLTFPITQSVTLLLISLTSAYFLIIYSLIGLELIIISLECLLLKFLFKDFNDKHYLKYPGFKKVSLMVITANIITLLIGFGIYSPMIFTIFG